MEASQYHIRYVGFEGLADGARRPDYAITLQGASARHASLHMPAAAFSGMGRVTFQESANICYESSGRNWKLTLSRRVHLRGLSRLRTSSNSARGVVRSESGHDR